MLKYFCDFCENPCSGSVTRRWEHIAGEMGLEVVILQGSSPITDKHLCDSCITKLFWDMIEKHTPNQGLNRLQTSLKTRELDFAQREKIILEKEQGLKTLQDQIDAKEKAIKSKEAELEKASAIIEQARIIKFRETEAVRLAEARGKQQAIDEYDLKRRNRERRA